jgi:hypothetical protein
MSADNRALLAAAMRWAHANGAAYARTKSWLGDRESRWDKADGACLMWDGNWLRYWDSAISKRFDIRPETVQDAIDHLVTAGVLHGSFHSLMHIDVPTALYEASLPEVYGEIWPDATPPERAIKGLLHPATVQACADLDHPIGIYSARTNASYCVCGQAMVNGNHRDQAGAAS